MGTVTFVFSNVGFKYESSYVVFTSPVNYDRKGCDLSLVGRMLYNGKNTVFLDFFPPVFPLEVVLGSTEEREVFWKYPQHHQCALQ